MDFFKQTDVKLFLVLIPVIKLVNSFLTFSDIVYNFNFVLAFLMDVMQGYFVWLVLRAIIKYDERKHPEVRFSALRLIKRIVFTFLAGLVVILIIPDGSFLITGTRYTAEDGSYYVHDLVLFFIWILLGNFIYILLRYYDTWKASEKKLLDEKKLKTEGITIKIGDKNVKIPLKDIHGFYVEDGYTFLINSNFSTLIVDSSLDSIEKRLPAQYFFRVNRKFILHRNAITSFRRIEDNKLMILTLKKDPLPGELPMSRLKAPLFKKWFDEDSTNFKPTLQP